MMIDEDKQAICDALCKALQLTVAGNDLISIEYKITGHGRRERSSAFGEVTHRRSMFLWMAVY